MAKKSKKIVAKPEIPMCWVVAYIDINHLKNLEIDLAYSKEYELVKGYIPTVKILNKKFKGKEEFDEVPLLFNYGFFQIPRHLAVSKAFLDNMKTNISCIFDWVKDPAKVAKKPILKEPNRIIHHDAEVRAATATSQEIADLVSMARENTIFSSIELDRAQVGSIVTLRGYPWEGTDATIVSVDKKKKKVQVSLILFNQTKVVDVNFDSIFFTVYNNYDPEVLSKDSVDGFSHKNTMNKIILD